MMTPRFSLSPRPVASGLALLIALAHGTIASAQGHTPDPYRPYNSVYDPYVYPIYPSGDGYFPNQNRLTGRSGPSQANQFQDFLDEDRLGSDPSRRACRGRPAPASPITARTAASTPDNRPNNSEADRLFREKQEERDTRYFEARKKYQEAVNERNPQKRARLIKEYAAAKRLAEQDFQRPRTLGARAEAGGRSPGARQSAGASTAAGCRTSPVLVARRSGSPEGDRPAGYGSASFVPSARPSRPRRIAAGRAQPLANPPGERVPGSRGPDADATPQAAAPAVTRPRAEPPGDPESDARSGRPR